MVFCSFASVYINNCASTLFFSQGLAERLNWCGAETQKDSFGTALLEAGVPEATIKAWTVDPQVKLPNGKKGSLFDALEDLDAPACLDKCVELSKL